MEKWVYKAGLALAVAAAFVTMAAGTRPISASSKQTTQEQPLPKGGRIIVKNQSGSITIRGWDKDTVRAVARGEEREGAVRMEEDASGALSIYLDRAVRRNSGESDLVIDVPKSARIDSANTANGDLTISDVNGPVNCSSGHGDVKVDRTGTLSAITGAGGIAVSQVSGSATVQTGGGDVNATSITGTLSATTGGGDVQASDAGSLKVRTGGGDITATAIKGSATVEDGSGDVTIRELKGDFVGRITSGDVHLENVGGLVNLFMTSGDVAVINPAGDVKIVSISGGVNVKCAGGNVEVSSADGEITLTGVAGDVDAKSTSGDVSFVGIVKPKGRYRLKSISGGVSMSIQADTPGFTATLSSFSGDIDTDFPIKLDNVMQRGPISRRVIGRYGNGQADITLDSFSGTVTLSKAAAGRIIDCK